MEAYIRIPLLIVTAVAAFAVALVALITGGYFYVEPATPEADELREVRFQIPMRVYSRDGRLMAQFGEEMRTPLSYDQFPELLIEAIIAAEDDRFFEHSGIDYAGIARGAWYFVTRPGERVPGGSTITQQITRVTNLLNRDYNLVRKFKEAILAFRIEREFTKEEILELYLNTYFFGQRSYGVVAAARTYFDKDLDELTLSEIAIIAGIPTGPSIMNPYNSPENARTRRSYVLRRLRELGSINDAEYQQALSEPIVSQRFGEQTALRADYVAEMVRVELLRRLGPAAYTSGLRVTTTIDSRLQTAANRSLRSTLIDYDERHGYRGALGQMDEEMLAALASDGDLEALQEIPAAELDILLDDYPAVLDLLSAVVLEVGETSARVYLAGQGVADIGLDSVAWARRYFSESRTGAAPEQVSDVLSPGDIVRFRRLNDGSLRLGQLPDVQGAFVSLDPQDGAVVALVGGFDYFLNNYNRATQTLRQPGSSFKPFVYSAALENGFTTASIVNDAPIVEASAELERVWKPENYTGVSHGEVRLREALKQSMNQAAIRTLRQVGLTNTIRHLRKFGFDATATPANEQLALGGGNLAPVDLARAYAVLANGGYSVEPYFIQRIEGANGDILYDASRSVAVVCRPDGTETTFNCQQPDNEGGEELIAKPADLYPDLRRAQRTVSPQNVYLVTDILKDVVRAGSGARAYRALGRRDLAGKTGTTNGPRDAWFAGFNADVAAVAWVGFDDDRDMGGREQGGVTAIPMWIGFMEEALRNQPESELGRPPGIVELRINPASGLVASDANRNAIWEKFRVDNVPEREPDPSFSLLPGERTPDDRSSTDAAIF